MMYDLLFSVDSNTYVGLFALINSILKNTKKVNDIRFNILIYDNIDFIKNNIDRYFKGNFRIKEFSSYKIYENFLKENIFVKGEKHTDITNIMNFARFYLPEIFDDVDIGLYIDCDMILQTDITNLYEDKNLPNNLENLDIASPLNKELGIMKFDPKLNIDEKEKGFNTGIYLYNLQKWRKNNYTKQCEEIMVNHKSHSLFNLGTQPIINYLYYKKCIGIDLKWNRTGLGINEYEESRLKKSFVLHWNGHHKPWLSDGYNKSLWDLYKLDLF